MDCLKTEYVLLNKKSQLIDADAAHFSICVVGWPFLDLNHARNAEYVFLKFELCLAIMNR